MEQTASLSEQVAAFAATVGPGTVPAPVYRTVKRLVLDTVGIGIGNAAAPPAAAVRAVVDDTADTGPASIWGSARTASAPMAALANGIAAHLSDFDDTHAESGVHPSASVVPAVLAAAEWRRASGQATLDALVVGYEVATRLGAAASHQFTLRGYHATSCCGTIAVAAAVATLLRLDAPRLASALGIAASQAGGLLQPLAEGSPVKALHPGWAAHAGVLAALSAAHGLTGPRRSLDGDQGFFAVLIGAERYRLRRVTEDLGTVWETDKVITKPYPCCHFLHALVDAAREFAATGGPDTVGDVVCRVPAQAQTVVCEPWADKLRPASGYAARFSLPYCVAVALVHGELRADHFDAAALDDARVRALMGRIRYELDPDPDLARTYGAELIVGCTDGGTWRRRVTHPLGSPQRPLDLDTVLAKFHANTADFATGGRRAELAEAILHLEQHDDLRTLLAITRTP